MRSTRIFVGAACVGLLVLGSDAIAQDSSGPRVLLERETGAAQSYYGYDGGFDWNGDGTPDFLVANDDRVSVSVVSGATGLDLRRFTDFGGGTVLDSIVAPDMTSDGQPDLVIGLNRGGKSTAPPPVVVLVNGETGDVEWTSAGNAPVETFGSDVESIGDVNSDGVPDVVAAGYLVARVLSGADGSRIQEFNSSGTCCPSDSVEVLGDIDGDGVDDFIVASSRYSGEPFGPSGPDSAGRALVVSGATGEILDAHEGKKPISLVGLNVVSPGDVDQDGVPDYAVSANIVKGKTFNPGFTIYSGRSHKKIGIVPVALIPGANGFNLLPLAPGDIDRDGLPDYLIRVLSDAGDYIAVLAGSPSRGPILFQYRVPDDDFLSSVGLAGDLSQPRDGIPDLIVGLSQANVVQVLEVEILPFIPGKVKNARALSRSAGIDEEISAKLSVVVKNGVQTFSLVTDGLTGSGAGKAATGPFGVFLENGVGSDEFGQVGTLDASGAFVVSAAGTVPPELGVSSLADLVGRRVQLRDGGGATLLETVVPSLDKEKKAKAKGALSPVSAEFPKAKLKLKASFNPKTGALDLKGKVKKGGDGPFVFELETAAGSDVYEEIARSDKGKLKLSTGAGAPLAGAFTVGDLLGRGVRVRSGETVILAGDL